MSNCRDSSSVHAAGAAPTLSVVIPTKNRHEYLSKVVESLLRIEADDLEIVVHDNSDDHEQFARWCATLQDPRLCYRHDSRPMSITENCDRALLQASGKVVCMIGDDDGLAHSVMDLARWMVTEGIEAAVSSVPTYLWPGVSGSLDGGQASGILKIPDCSGEVRVIDERETLQAVLDFGAIRIGNLPSVYQGLISRATLQRLWDLVGTYVPGPSPDMANAVGLAAVIREFVKVDAPIVISGSCPRSGAAEGARHAHESEISEKKFLAPGTAEAWPSQVPFYFSGPTLYAATAIHALSATGRDDLVQMLRMDRLYAACAVFNPRYRDRVDDARSRNRHLVSSFGFYVSIGWVWRLRAQALAGNLLQKLSALWGGNRRVTGLPHMGEVTECLARMHKPISFSARRQS